MGWRNLFIPMEGNHKHPHSRKTDVYLNCGELSTQPLAVRSPGAVGFLLYFLVGQASLLSRVVGGGNVHKAVDGAGNNVVWNTYRAVHLTIGLVIMIPILVVAFFPFMTHFQVRGRPTFNAPAVVCGISGRF